MRKNRNVENVLAIEIKQKTPKNRCFLFYFASYLFSVLMHLVQTFSFLPSTFFVCRFTWNFLLEAILEWLLETPEVVPLPHTLHTRLIIFRHTCNMEHRARKIPHCGSKYSCCMAYVICQAGVDLLQVLLYHRSCILARARREHNYSL